MPAAHNAWAVRLHAALCTPAMRYTMRYTSLISELIILGI